MFHTATLTCNDLVLPGDVMDVGQGGVFLRTSLLVEVGELGMLELDDEGSLTGVPVRVVWLRSATHASGPGMGLAFELADPVSERRAVELLLAVLDGVRA